MDASSPRKESWGAAELEECEKKLGTALRGRNEIQQALKQAEAAAQSAAQSAREKIIALRSEMNAVDRQCSLYERQCTALQKLKDSKKKRPIEPPRTPDSEDKPGGENRRC